MARIALTEDQRAALNAKWAQLIETINQEHQACNDGFVSAVQAAARAGTALATIKSRVSADRCAAWLRRENCHVSARRTAIYIKLAAAFPSLATTAPQVTDATLRAVLQRICERGTMNQAKVLQKRLSHPSN